MKFLPADRQPTVAVVGFGYVGSCIGATLAARGLHVLGVDRDTRLISEMAAGYCRFNEPGLGDLVSAAIDAGTLALTADYARISAADVIIIAVATPVDENRQILTGHLESACDSLAPHLRPGQLVIIKSTVSPGTTRLMVRPALEKGGLEQGRDFGLAFCPERLAEGNALAQFQSVPIVVGGCDDDSAAAARQFWTSVLDVEVVSFAGPDAAEMVKLADNWWIDLNIAMANELARLCGVLDIDVLDVIAGANSLPKGSSFVNVLLPSVGVGGSCLTKDPWILWSTAQRHGLDLQLARTGREVNDSMPGYATRLLLSELTALGKDPAAAKVAVLGLAFKNNTNDLRRTPVLPVVQQLRESCREVSIFDPLVAAPEAQAEFGLAPAGSLAEAVQGADCVAVLAGHDCLRELDLADLAGRVSAPCLIFDGRAYYSRPVIEQMQALGFAYRGIGR